MDSVSARPAVSAPPPPTAQEAQRGAAASELLPAKTVTRNEAGEKAGNRTDRPTGEPRAAKTTKALSLDAETQSVILKKTDTDTGQVLEQYPNNAQLGLRSYARELLAEKPAYDEVA